MNNWTISRRVIGGFAAMLLIIVTLGVFALWRLMGLAEDIAYVADNSVPSILTLREASNISRDNLILLLQIDPSNTTDRNSVLEQKISTNGARRDELIKSYESLISDAEDRRLYEEIKRTSDVARASRRRALELLKENKVDEFRKVQQEEVIPEYEKYLKAIDLDIDYNEKLARTYADHGKKSVLFSVRLIGVALGLASLLALLLAWQVIRSTNRALKDITVNLDRGSIQTASAARQVSMAVKTSLPEPVSRPPQSRRRAHRSKKCPA